MTGGGSEGGKAAGILKNDPLAEYLRDPLKQPERGDELYKKKQPRILGQEARLSEGSGQKHWRLSLLYCHASD